MGPIKVHVQLRGTTEFLKIPNFINLETFTTVLVLNIKINVVGKSIDLE